ncbi:MAG: acyl-CoA thioesterase [Paramuribaculum sp.]|nr:acyl-CoA thioesterase [Paramuribaculum sp.]
MTTYLPSDNPRVPEARHPFRHCIDVQTRFTDIDLIGHVNNNVYLSFMDLAKIDYFTTVLQRKLTPRDLCMVVAHIDCDYFEPAYFDNHLQVWTTIIHHGERSITLQQRIVDADTMQTKCIGTTVMVGFDPVTTRSAPIDTELIARLTDYEKRPI